MRREAIRLAARAMDCFQISDGDHHGQVCLRSIACVRQSLTWCAIEGKQDVLLLRRVFIAALLLLATPTLAVAQGNNPQQPGGSKPPAGARPPGGSGQPALRPGAPPGTRTLVVPHAGPQPGFARPQTGVVAPPLPGVVAPPQRGVIPPPQPGFASPPAGGQAAHQFTWRGRAFARVQAAPFVYPSGYAYQRWAVGAILPPLLLAPEYFYPGWDALGLDPPPPYFEWVRYGPDLLLVNVTTGEVADTIYDAFE
jgi:Ni/Co efflux regulator RcnB